MWKAYYIFNTSIFKADLTTGMDIIMQRGMPIEAFSFGKILCLSNLHKV